MGKFVIKIGKNGHFRFNLKANNGQIILSSEQYTTKAACNNGINSVKENAKSDERFERGQASNGQFYFKLKAKNGQIIGNSELYDSATGRDNGIASVKRNAPKATVEEDFE